MPKLTDTQRVILAAAAQRDGGAVLPLPKTLKLQGGAVTSVLKGLAKRGFAAERRAARKDTAWRETVDGERFMLIITEAGLMAIGVEPDAPSDAPPSAKTPKRRPAGSARDRQPKATTAPASIRPGTKQAVLIDLLKRKSGATITEAVDATGWQPHSVRGAISGTLRKKLGLAIASEAVEGRGRVYRIVAQG